MKLQRYNVHLIAEGHTEAAPDSQGMFVDASDAIALIAELEAENARLRSELAALATPKPVADNPKAHTGPFPPAPKWFSDWRDNTPPPGVSQ